MNLRSATLTQDFDFAIDSLSLVGFTGGVVTFGNLYDLTTHTVGPLIASASPLAAVPEPATWALMLAGFGGLGAVLRQNRTKSHAAVA